MFGFPVNLQDSNVQKLTNDADNNFPKIQQREIFYSVKDGDWLDSTIWQTASGRVGMIPGINDDVYIKTAVKIQFLHPVFGGAYFCNNLFVSGTFNFYNFSLNVYGNFKNVGIVNSGLGTGFFSELKLYGVENVLGTINQNNWTNIHYARNGVQYIQPFNYYRLTTSGLGVKYLTSNTIVLNNLICADTPTPYIGGIVNSSDDKLPMFECAGYELEVYGETRINQWCIFKQSGSGRLKFRGLLGVGYGLQYAGGFLLPGNPEVECQNGLFVSYDINLGYGTRGGFYSGLGTWRFTTNNQYIWTNVSSTTQLTFDAPILIAPGITLSHHNIFNANGTMLYLKNTINGESSTSKLENRGNLVFATAASVPSMTTGIVDFTTFTNTIYYSGDYTATMPSHISTFHNLTISGTGTKSLGVDTTLNGDLYGNGGGGFFNTSTRTLSVNGTSLFQNYFTFQNTGGGNLLFVGLLRFGSTFTDRAFIDFASNPNVECRGGVQFNTGYGYIYECGTGIWSFTTNNQNIQSFWDYSGRTKIHNILIVGNITLTYNAPAGNPNFGALEIQNSLNGTTSLSKFLLGSDCVLYIKTANNMMPTGIFDHTTNNNTIVYTSETNHSLQFTTYKNLSVGFSGIKTMSGNTTINGNLNVGTDAPGYFDSSIYSLSVVGNTNIYYGTLKNTGGGSMLFTGLLSFGFSFTSQSFIDFSGNPNVECRGGARFYRGYGTIFDCGNGTWTFTTNDQTISHYGEMGGYVIMNNVLISGAITLTYSQLNVNSDFRIKNSLNGNNANSKFLIGASTIYYHNAPTQPMTTGILDTSTNLHTFIYGNSNQDIKGGPTTGAKQVYRNLTLNGGGTKTLQGYVSVLNTYTLTSPATLANNGFTLTNP